MVLNKFTQEIKDNWLQALKSGKYKQGYGALVNHTIEGTFYCCIGVLGEVTDGLADISNCFEKSPYTFLDDTIGEDNKAELIRINDSFATYKAIRPLDYKDDYSNVIPLIESLPVQTNNFFSKLWAKLQEILLLH